MDVMVRLTQVNGHYSAAILGDESVSATGPTQEAAVASLRNRVQEGMQRSELLTMRVNVHPVLAMAGLLKDDPGFAEIVEEAYRERDAERIAEHGE